MERHKRSYRCRHHKALFGKVNGELCIQSVKFSEEATRFCLALRQGYLWRHVPGQASKQGLIEHILYATGKHNLLLAPSDTVTPAIVAAIESRNTGNSWDRLDITANCCQYSTRLVTEHLKGENSSLSLSLLAMCLLNGEILHNGGREESKLSSGMTVSMFLKAQLFSGFKGPAAQESLTFNNGCRFFNVSLDQNGICTRGHLWKLGKTIDTSKYPPQGDWVNDPHGLLSLCQRKQLVYFAQRLRSSGHLALSRTILRYLDHDAWIMATIPNPRRWLEGRLVERYMHIMASELADAIAEGRTL
ncbi:hypothetical protein S7711_09657 [Stachybotrys chartarum IBT 7711]|uniref:Uncharacterized protein n=1 Tax=Stachybotrys chartarum (strain CBS 109288 / IBT 7711) TaxID=1280523 RepID=A0A084BBX1_STACB|nr:hypothetical protein S7711_09657 [Stachybotrys chartarum IBT 7711]